MICVAFLSGGAALSARPGNSFSCIRRRRGVPEFRRGNDSAGAGRRIRRSEDASVCVRGLRGMAALRTDDAKFCGCPA